MPISDKDRTPEIDIGLPALYVLDDCAPLNVDLLDTVVFDTALGAEKYVGTC